MVLTLLAEASSGAQFPEVDPIAFALSGHSMHLGLTHGAFRIELVRGEGVVVALAVPHIECAEVPAVHVALGAAPEILALDDDVALALDRVDPA